MRPILLLPLLLLARVDALSTVCDATLEGKHIVARSYEGLRNTKALVLDRELAPTRATRESASCCRTSIGFGWRSPAMWRAGPCASRSVFTSVRRSSAGACAEGNNRREETSGSDKPSKGFHGGFAVRGAGKALSQVPIPQDAHPA